MSEEGVLGTARKSITDFSAGITNFASSAVESTSAAVGLSSKKEEGFVVVAEANKDAERKARLEASAAAQSGEPMAKVTEMAKEYYGRARTFTEENISPVVAEKAAKAKDVSMTTYSQLAEEVRTAWRATPPRPHRPRAKISRSLRPACDRDERREHACMRHRSRALVAMRYMHGGGGGGGMQRCADAMGAASERGG
jgi:hypothetical protein